MSVKGWYHVDDDIALADAVRACRREPLERLPVHLHLDLTGPDDFDRLAQRFGPDVMIGDALRTLIAECGR